MPCPVLVMRLDPWLASAQPHPVQSCPGAILRRRDPTWLLCIFDGQGFPFWPVEKLLLGEFQSFQLPLQPLCVFKHTLHLICQSFRHAVFPRASP